MPLDHLKRPNPRKVAESVLGGTPPAPSKPPAAKPKAVVEDVPRVVYACGHTRPVPSYKYDPCPACARRNQTARRRRAAEKQAGREIHMPVRLPAGSNKHLTWDGENWAGHLVINQSGSVPIFHYTAATERECFHGLHNEYAKWLRENGGLPPLESGGESGG